MASLLLSAFFLLVATHNVLCSVDKKCADSSSVGDPLILTPYIKNGNIKTAKELSKFKILGWTGYSGYFTVNDDCGGHLFCVFVEAKNNPKTAPVFLWLNGGPGSSSMYGFLVEIGPFKSTNSSRIELRDITWNDNNNIIYIDQPVGTGFSFPKNSCLADNMAMSTDQLYSALAQFYKMFPEYQKNKFYIAGQSFAGHFIPPLANLIHDKNQISGVEVKINLAGTLIGNPSIRLDCRNYAPFLYSLGLVTAEVRDVFNDRYLQLVSLIEKEKYLEAYHYWSDTGVLIRRHTKLPNLFNVNPYKEDTSESDYWYWLETSKARCQLNIGNTTFDDFNGDVFDKYLEEIPKSAKYAHYVEKLLNAKYTVIFYSGNMDLQCLTSSTDCLLRGLEWWGAEGFRKANRTAWFHDGMLAGYRQHYGNLAFVIINGAGHVVPYYKSPQIYDLIKCIDFPCKDDYFCHLNTTQT